MKDTNATVDVKAILSVMNNINKGKESITFFVLQSTIILNLMNYINVYLIPASYN